MRGVLVIAVCNGWDGIIRLNSNGACDASGRRGGRGDASATLRCVHTCCGPLPCVVTSLLGIYSIQSHVLAYLFIMKRFDDIKMS